jgi:HK97 gp10 family phage protein
VAKETFTIRGVTEIQRAFDTLGRKLGRKVIRQEVRKGVKVLADEVKARAPVYKPKSGPAGRSRSTGRFTRSGRRDVDVGALKRDVRVRARPKKKRGVIAFDVVTGKGTKKTRGAYYAGMVEYGTSKMRAQPFIRPAFDANKDRIARMVQAGIRAGIDREVKAARTK